MATGTILLACTLLLIYISIEFVNEYTLAGQIHTADMMANIVSFFTTKGSRGTGIVLMATQKLVKEMNGTIMANSGVGEGATVTITIPSAHMIT